MIDAIEGGTSDIEMARRLRRLETPGFLELAQLLGTDVKALQALRVEVKFMRSHPGVSQSPAFAKKVRAWLIANKLDWTEENLSKAVASIPWPVFRQA